MGINYYIRINIKGRNDMIYSDIVCHIGHNDHLDFINLCKFFDCFYNDSDDSDSEDSNAGSMWVKLFKRLCCLRTKIENNTVLEEDAKDFRQFLYDIFDNYIPTTGEFCCEDEYGHSMTFKEIIDRMSTRNEGIQFKAYDYNGYIMDGLFVNNNTDFF